MQNRNIFATLFLLLIVLFAEAQTSYTLEQALRTARENNRQLRVEKYNLNIAETDVIDAKLRPNLNLSNESIQMTRQRDFEKEPWSSPYNREMMWQLSKTFQIAGQRKHKIEFAERNVDFAQRSFVEVESELLAEVAEKWIEVWTAIKQLEVIQTAKQYTDTLITINERRLHNNAITETEMMRTRLISNQFEIQHKTFIREFENRQKELQYLLGVTADVAIDTADQFLYPIPAHPDTLLRLALENRSDLKASQSLLAMSEANIKLQNSLAYPQPELGLVWNPQNAVPHVGFLVGIELPIFNRNQAERKKSLLMRDQAQENVSATQIQLENEIQIAFANYSLQAENAESYTTILQQSQEILDNVRYAYERGGTTIIDFLEAQRSWLETREEYYEILNDFRQSYIQLLFTSGLINLLAQ